MGKKSEQGNVLEIVIIAVLALALVGVLVWRFFDTQQATTEKTADQATNKTIADNSTDKTPSASVEINSNEGYVVIDTWGVKFKAPTDGTTVKWSRWSNGTTTYEDTIGFTTSNLKEKDICTAQQGVAGTLQRSNVAIERPMSGTVTLINDGKPIDGYYYAYTRPNGDSCEDTNPSQYDETLRVEALVKTLMSK